MSKKSVLGAGDEFGWVGGAQKEATNLVDESINLEGDKETDGQVDKATNLEGDMSTSSQVDILTNDYKSENKKKSRKEQKKSPDKLQKIGVYLEPQVVLDLKMQALLEGRSISSVIQELVKVYLKRKKQN